MTQFHRVLERLERGYVSSTTTSDFDINLLADMKAAPLYATDTDVLALALCDEGYESVKALFQAGLGKHLPHPQVLVEVSAPGRRERTFVFLAEKRIDVTVNDTFTIHSDFVAGCVVLRPVVVDGHECEVLLIESCGP